MHALALIAVLALAHALRPVKVFGVGLSKTGTTALCTALGNLGYRAVHNDQAFAPFLYPSHNAVSVSGMSAHWLMQLAVQLLALV